MRTYELIYLISSELKAEEAGTLVSEINALLQEEGATITRAENPVPKTLSYQIKKQGTAFQASVEFSLLPEKIKTVEDKIRKNQRIIRYLLIFKKPEPKETTKRASEENTGRKNNTDR